MNSIQQAGDQVKAEYMPIVVQAEELSVSVNSPESYETAGLLFKKVKQAIKEVGTKLDPFVQMAHKSWKDAVAERQKYLEPLEKAESLLAPAISNYQEEQRRIQEEAQRKAEAEARKLAEDELLARAEAEKQAGNAELAESMLNQQAIPAPIRAQTPQMPKIKGLSYRESYSCQVVDFKALIKSVASGTIPVAALLPNESFLNGQAKQLKGEFSFAGCKVIKTNTPVSR